MGGSDGLYTESYTYDSATGNLATKASSPIYQYADPAHAHAVTAIGTSQYTYDANRNMITRPVNGGTATLSYDAENRLSCVYVDSNSNGVCESNEKLASFVYDGDGNRVQSAITNDGTTTITSFVGNYYEVTGTAVTKYYYAGAQRIAIRTASNVCYLLSDQLGSSTVTADATGGFVSEMRYTAWGQIRFPTNSTNPGQYSNAADFGLMFYSACW